MKDSFKFFAVCKCKKIKKWNQAPCRRILYRGVIAREDLRITLFSF